MKFHTYIKYLAKKHKVKKEEMLINIKEQYPYLYLQTFTSLFYSVALAGITLKIATDSLRKLNKKGF